MYLTMFSSVFEAYSKIFEHCLFLLIWVDGAGGGTGGGSFFFGDVRLGGGVSGRLVAVVLAVFFSEGGCVCFVPVGGRAVEEGGRLVADAGEGRPAVVVEEGFRAALAGGGVCCWPRGGEVFTGVSSSNFAAVSSTLVTLLLLLLSR